MKQEKFAIRFGLGGIKAVGFNVMETAIKERESGGKFKDIYEFAERLDPKSINKKSIEALAKSGAFIDLVDNRRQVAESFDILSAYSAKKTEEATSNQMSLFMGTPEADAKPSLKRVEDWDKPERLKKEFEAFGFFLNEHPLDDTISDLRKRGVIFSDKFELDDLEDNSIIKMAGVVAASKHRSSARGRFAYMSISDPYGIFEAMIFDEEIITSSRDLLANGSAIAMGCLIRKDEGGTRVLIRDVTALDDFIKHTKAQDKDFEDIKKKAKRNYKRKDDDNSSANQSSADSSNQLAAPTGPAKKVLSKVEIIIKTREPIFAVKPMLSQFLALDSSPKTTAVIFSVASGKNIIRLELPQKYLLDEADVARLRRIENIIDVEPTT